MRPRKLHLIGRTDAMVKVVHLLLCVCRASENGAVLGSEYLSAGCRLLSSAQLPNPKLRLSYTVANPKQEQVYTIEPGSAHNWLLCNHSWAHKLWSV